MAENTQVETATAIDAPVDTSTGADRAWSRVLLGVVVVMYWVVAGLFAVRTPDWQTPDEPAHYNYIAQIADDGRLPVVEMGDWDQAYQGELTASGFAPELLDELDTVQYEDHQPPLYYLLATPVHLLTDGNLTALRLFSVAIGTIIVLSAYGVALVMFPQRPWIAPAVAAFVAFQPMHVMFLASVNNDTLGWAVVALTLLVSVIYVKGGRVPVWLLGALVGIGLITKATTYMMAGVAGVAILLRWWSSEDRRIATLFQQITLFLVPALALGLTWWLRNFDVYGFPDFLGLAAHDEIVVGQPRTAEMIDERGFAGYLTVFLRTTFNSFWAQFGWMGVPLQPRDYTLLRGVLIVVFAGIGVDMFRRRNALVPSVPQRNAWILLVLTTILAMLAYVYYNTEFLQHQGRYMFPLLIPLGIWLALGVDGWRGLIVPTGATLRRLTPYLTPLAFFALAVWAVWLLWRVIVPNLS